MTPCDLELKTSNLLPTNSSRQLPRKTPRCLQTCLCEPRMVTVALYVILENHNNYLYRNRKTMVIARMEEYIAVKMVKLDVNVRHG